MSILSNPVHTKLLLAFSCVCLMVAAGNDPVFAQSGSPSKFSPEFVREKLENFKSEIELLNLQKEFAQAARDRLIARRHEIAAKQDLQGVSSESFPEIMKSLQSNRVDLMIDLAGIDARLTALLKFREEMAKKQTESVIEPLSKVLKLEEERLKEIERIVGMGNAAKSELEAAQIRVLEAQVRLAQAKQPPHESGSNQELLAISLDRAEKQARLEKVEMLLKSFAASRESLEESAQIDLELNEVSKRSASFNSDVVSIEAEIELLRGALKSPKKTEED
jgi:hypothetical protein